MPHTPNDQRSDEPRSQAVRFSGILTHMRRTKTVHQLPEPTARDLERIEKLLRRIGGPNVTWGAKESLDVWATEQRARLDQQMSDRVRSASWALVITTIGLVICTGGLIWATLTI